MKPGALYKVVISELGLIQKSNNITRIFTKDTILTFLKVEWGYSGEDAYFFADNNIYYRRIYGLEDWIQEVNENDSGKPIQDSIFF